MPKVNGKAKPILDPDSMRQGKREPRAGPRLLEEIASREKTHTKKFDNSLKLIFDEFLEHTLQHREKDTYEDYRRTLLSFKDK
jgi:hypothetical protein